MIRTPERDLVKCDHRDVLVVRNNKCFSFCKTCGFGFYKDIVLIKPERRQINLTVEIPTLENDVQEPFLNSNYITKEYLEHRGKTMRQMW